MKVKVRSGELRHRVLFRLPARSADADAKFGEATVGVFLDSGNTWAKIDQLSADELIAAGVVSPTATHRVIIRYDPAFATTSALMRIIAVDLDLTFEIVSVENPEWRNQWLVYLVRESR